MAAPSKNFTIISDSAIDADSPITADLMTDFRDNDIHLEEWLGLDYTAAQNHDHDGVNSATVNISNVLTAYNAQLTTDMNGGSWNVDTGSLGFTPQAMVIHWGGLLTSQMIYGWGMGMGTDAGDQHGTSVFIDTGPAWDNVSVDANDIMGFTGTGGSQFNSSFGTERARIDEWGSSNIEIQTQTGSWWPLSRTIYINVQVWGA